MQLTIDPKVKEAGVSLAYSVIEFKNEAHNEGIWQELLNPLIQKIEEEDTLDSIKEDPQILATKKVYRVLGKDPARFRPSSDSLWRRIVQQKGLYQINALVDLNNYFSLKWKLPFGAYDLEKVTDSIHLTVGTPEARYAGIGNKSVNIENLLVLEDGDGPFGSPTSDSTRGMITEETTQALLVGYQFQEDTAVNQAELKSVLETYLTDCRILEQGVI
ncbi:B3/B4 domain-containing protein [Enterococcus raffinosus]|uniref:Phenylalanine--tRNA ligase beta subunit-related protein n=1 Tax=Enterococcus raffinosus TaxID=71452 RepID=A0AAW8T5M6_9ENTE|nr:phenylalanine--tRNA ligase beta subunit-related protein [Enterococcus raffinosus]MDT2522077.1 phenylalanine--tRNA ligase beta subunit-related protein [Enterococcus raffinosus]MDT2528421.1 phenylalanine--tRNA ligase beta subunit-related protein [Enterococcus raffinosus]MDT2533112.1 phenylalanine--tRNA ligase beta subunit-related protein [Enterococcus raffinosus]MDT2543552.1 phenylalanine--tRNA ligase beta subunit-related protein [Enterococcus raffinosus]MDT2553666.1 phenylalanine--tRNA ligas